MTKQYSFPEDISPTVLILINGLKRTGIVESYILETDSENPERVVYTINFGVRILGPMRFETDLEKSIDPSYLEEIQVLG